MVDIKEPRIAALFFAISCVLLFVMAWIQPFHFLPWPSAINNGITCIAGLLLALNAFYANKRSIKFDERSIFVVVLMAIAFFVNLNFQAQSWPLEYLLLFILGFLIYKTSGQNGEHALVYISIASASSITAFLAIGGLFDLVELGADWNLPVSTSVRWQGFLMQANNTGTLLVLGYLAVVYQVEQFSKNSGPRVYRALAGTIGCVLVTLIGLAGVLVQSRTMALNFFLIILVGILYLKKMRGISLIMLMVGPSAYLMGQWLLPKINRLTTSMSSDSVGFGGRGLDSNLRFEIWTDLLGALWQQPWLGYGVGGTVKAFLAIESPSVVYGTYFSHAHNIVLELLLWFGIPLGSVMVFFAGRSLWRIARHANEKTILPAMMLMTLLVHAMLELPLHYAYFLIPMTIIWGWLSGQLPEQYQQKPLFTVSVRWFSGVAMLVLVPMLYVVSVTYLHHEQSLRQAKLEMAIKGWVSPAEPPPFPVLWELEALNDFVRVQDTDLLAPAQLMRFHEVVSVYPAKTMIQKAVAVFSHNGDTARATYWRNKGCLIYAGDFCEKVTDVGSG